MRKDEPKVQKHESIRDIVVVQYKDHHWFDDDLSEEEILAINDMGDKSFILSECGFVLRETRDYLIISSHREQQRLPPLLDETVWKNSTRILKPTIISIQKFKVKDWEYSL